MIPSHRQVRLQPNYNSSLLIQEVASKTCQKRWTKGTSGGGMSGKSLPAARYDNGDDIYIYVVLGTTKKSLFT